jgi:hypothetical protein
MAARRHVARDTQQQRSKAACSCCPHWPRLLPAAPLGWAQVCAHLWEFAVVFGSWYLSNRVMMLWVHRGTEGGSQELWRGSQVWGRSGGCSIRLWGRCKSNAL